MKVLWFVNVPFPAVERRLNFSFKGGGGWMQALARVLCRDYSVKLGVAANYSASAPLVEFESEGISYYTLSNGHESACGSRGPLSRSMRVIDSFLPSTDRRIMSTCRELVNRFDPDVIHVHGSEEAWGLIARECNVPTVVSIQGVVNGCLPRYWGTCPKVWRGLMPREWKYWLEYRFRRAPREREIFRTNRYFLGRTGWDQTWQRTLQPEGRYWNVGELIRPEFYEVIWQVDGARRFALLTTTSSAPLKGTDVLIRAVDLLRRRYPLVHLYICGDLGNQGWGAYLHRLVRNLRLQERVSFLGYLHAHQIAEQLSRTHVYVLPSHIENSSNSLCEAQLVGVPCVASSVGGIPSLIQEGCTGLLCPPGDHIAMAGLISHLFDNDEFARSLGAQTRTMAHLRHAPNLVAKSLLRAYREAIDLAGAKAVQGSHLRPAG